MQRVGCITALQRCRCESVVKQGDGFTSTSTSARQARQRRARKQRDEGHTYQPRPETLDPVPRRGLVVGDRLDLLQARDEVHLFGLDEWRAEVELRANVENGEQDEGDVVRDERIRRPVSLKEYCPTRELQRRMSEGARA